MLKVRTNADTPDDATTARGFGAEGIGLFRTEHMFYGKGSEQPLFLLRKMILSSSEAERKAAIDELFPFVKKDIKATLEVMDGLPVTIRLLDPPLHEFVPNDPRSGPGWPRRWASLRRSSTAAATTCTSPTP